MAVARAKRNLWKFFNRDWAMRRSALHATNRFDAIKSAVRSFHNRGKGKATPEVDFWSI